MIEVPRAALLASEVAAAGAEFFSYGTNDLTQMTYGYSRDDVGSFMPVHLGATPTSHSMCPIGNRPNRPNQSP